ncbi:MAG: cell division protein FtsW, partial [Alphaproteobacteria bacterium]|nr:cell division protein FtsW [Alphaproteobacteria bacterium]
MSLLPRTDRSWTAQWVWTVDRVTIGAVAALVVFGVVLIATAGPAVAELNGASRFHFLAKHAA